MVDIYEFKIHIKTKHIRLQEEVVLQALSHPNIIRQFNPPPSLIICLFMQQTPSLYAQIKHLHL
jgi:hypothetical protein